MVKIYPLISADYVHVQANKFHPRLLGVRMGINLQIGGLGKFFKLDRLVLGQGYQIPVYIYNWAGRAKVTTT